MNKIILPIFLLLGMPALPEAASVTDPRMLDAGVKETFSKLQQTTVNSESAYSYNYGHKQTTSAVPLPSKQDTPNNRDAHVSQPSHRVNNSPFGFVQDSIASSDDAVWKKLSSTVKDVNESLNKIDQWAENILNTSATNIDLSSINLRNTIFIQENANLRSVIGNQENGSEYLTELDQNSADNLDLKAEYGLLHFLLTPSLLLKALAENFSVIVLLFSMLMGLRLLMKFFLEKVKKRQRRRKGRRKRSIDGFIN